MAAERVGAGAASARVALAGNPSDGYGGAVLAVELAAFRAEASARVAGGPGVDPPSDLVLATVRRFAALHDPLATAAMIRWTTSIPRQVGLGGSSAIVIAVTRALCEQTGVELSADALAAFALAVETDELGIAAGLQDRLAQSCGGLIFMEFSEPPVWERLDRRRLPPLVVAWRAAGAAHSGPGHASLRERHRRGEPIVVESMAVLADAARHARAALRVGDTTAFAAAVDATFDARRRMVALDPAHVEMVEIARRAGAAANYTGSGGAIVAVARDARHVAGVMSELDRAGCATVALTPSARP